MSVMISSFRESLFLLRRGRHGAGWRYVAVEAEDVLRIVAVLERDQALPDLRRVGGPHPLRACLLEVQKIDVSGAGREGTHRLGHAVVVRSDPFGQLGRRGGPDPDHHEPRVAVADGAGSGRFVPQRPAELAYLELDQGRPGARAGRSEEHTSEL